MTFHERTLSLLVATGVTCLGLAASLGLPMQSSIAAGSESAQFGAPMYTQGPIYTHGSVQTADAGAAEKTRPGGPAEKIDTSVTDQMVKWLADHNQGASDEKAAAKQLEIASAIAKDGLSHGLQDTKDFETGLRVQNLMTIARLRVEQIGEAAVSDEAVKNSYETYADKIKASDFYDVAIASNHVEGGEAAEKEAVAKFEAAYEKSHDLAEASKLTGFHYMKPARPIQSNGVPAPAKEAINAVKDGEIAGPIVTGQTVYFYLRNSVAKGVPEDFDKIRPQIARALEAEASKAYIDSLTPKDSVPDAAKSESVKPDSVKTGAGNKPSKPN